jgi:hypothetical protein
MLPAIGSVSALAGQGRVGVVVSAQPIGEAEDGRQLVALRIREGEKANQIRAEQQPSGTQAGQTQPSNATADGRRASRPETDSPLAARLSTDLSPSEKAAVARLQQRDQQVKQEEKAHAAVAGDLAGPINYVYQRGPDGRQYAVGGSVGISAQTRTGDPEEAKRLGARIAVAANAATNPSAQDYATARQAYALAANVTSPSARAAPAVDFSS